MSSLAKKIYMPGENPEEQQKKPPQKQGTDSPPASGERPAGPAGADAPTRGKLIGEVIDSTKQKGASASENGAADTTATDKKAAGKTVRDKIDTVEMPAVKTEAGRAEGNLSKTGDRAKVKDATEKAQGLAERLNTAGILVFRDKTGQLHQAAVRHDNTVVSDGKIVGNFNSSGEVNFNQEGQSKFRVDAKLDVNTAQDAVFYSLDQSRPEIISSNTTKGGNKTWNGNFIDLQNKPKYKYQAGNVFAQSGTFMGRMDEDNKLELPAEKIVFGKDKDENSRSTGIELNDLNTVLGEGLTFVGTAKNKDDQEYPITFNVDSNLNSGTWIIPKNPGEENQKYENYNIRLGMIFDAQDNLCGYFRPPQFSADGWLRREGQVLTKRPDENGTQSPTANGPRLLVINGAEDLRNLESRTPSEFPLSVYTVHQHGETALKGITNGAVCLGSKRQADGTYAENQGYLPTGLMQVTVKAQQEAAQREISDVLQQQKGMQVDSTGKRIAIASLGPVAAVAGAVSYMVTPDAKKEIEKQNKIDAACKEKLDLIKEINKGNVDGISLEKLQEYFSETQAAQIGKFAQIDQRDSRLGELPKDLSQVNGHIITIDREAEKAQADRRAAWFASPQYAAWRAEHPNAPSPAEAERESAKPVKRLEVRNGDLYDSKNQYQGKLAWENNQLVWQPHPSKTVEITDPSLARSFFHLEVPDPSQANGKRTVELAVVPNGQRNLILSPEDMIRKGGEVVEQALATANENPNDETVQEAAKYAKIRLRSTYKEDIALLVSNLKHGEYTKANHDFVVDGTTKQIAPALADAKERLKIIGKPIIDTAERAKTVSGSVQIGNATYEINKGNLLSDGQVIGQFKPGYVLEFQIANPKNPDEPIKKYVDLNETNGVLLSIKIGNDPRQHDFIGLGPDQIVPNYGHQAGGLMYANDFRKQVNEQLARTKEARDSHDNPTNPVILAVTDWISGGIGTQLNANVHTVDLCQAGFNKSLDEIFGKFRAGTLDSSELSRVAKYTQTLANAAGIFADSTASLSQIGQELKGKIQTGLEMAAIQGAVTIATGGLGAIAGSAEIAELGLGGRLLVQTAKIMSSGGGKLFTASAVGAATSVAIRENANTNTRIRWDNAISGSLEGLANMVGGGELEELAEGASFVTRLAHKGLGAAQEIATAHKGAWLYSIAGNIRTGEEITLSGLALNTATEYLGDLGGGIFTKGMDERSLGHSIAESVISNWTDGTTGSWAEAVAACRGKYGNNYTNADVAKEMFMSGAWSATAPTALASHAIGKVQHHNQHLAVQKEHLRGIAKSIEQSDWTPQQRLAKKHLEFTANELAAALENEEKLASNTGDKSNSGSNGNGGDNGNNGNKGPQTPSKPNGQQVASSGNDAGPVAANSQRFYYVQPQGQAEIHQEPVNQSERERINELDAYVQRQEASAEDESELAALQKRLAITPLDQSERDRVKRLEAHVQRQEASVQEEGELAALQKRLAITPLNETEQSRLAQLRKTLTDGGTISIETLRECRDLVERERAIPSDLLVFNEDGLHLAQIAAGDTGRIMVVDIANPQLRDNGVVQESGVAILNSLELVRGAREYAPARALTATSQQQGSVNSGTNVAATGSGTRPASPVNVANRTNGNQGATDSTAGVRNISNPRTADSGSVARNAPNGNEGAGDGKAVAENTTSRANNVVTDADLSTNQNIVVASQSVRDPKRNLNVPEDEDKEGEKEKQENVASTDTANLNNLEQLFARGNWAAAEAMAKQLLEQKAQSETTDTSSEPNSGTQTLAILAESQLRQGKFDQADQTFQRAWQAAHEAKPVLERQSAQVADYIKQEQKKGGDHSRYLDLAMKQAEREIKFTETAHNIANRLNWLNERARINAEIASARNLVATVSGQNNLTNQTEARKQIFNVLINKEDFAAAEEFARRQLPMEKSLAEIAKSPDAAERERAAWALASMGMAQYMQRDINKMAQAESLLNSALTLTYEVGEDMSQEDRDRREYLFATQLAQGKFSAGEANAIRKAWAVRDTAFNGLLDYQAEMKDRADEAERLASQMQDADPIASSSTSLPVTEPYLPPLNLVEADDITTPSNNSATVLPNNSIAQVLPANASQDLDVSNRLEDNNPNRLNGGYLGDRGNRIGNIFPIDLPDVQLVNQDDGIIDFSAMPDITAERIAKSEQRTDRASGDEQLAALSNEQLRQEYLNLSDQIGTLQNIANAIQAGNIERALQFSQNISRARIAQIHKDLILEIERRRARNQDDSRLSQVKSAQQKFRSNIDRQLEEDFDKRFYSRLGVAQAEAINDQEATYGQLKERGIEIPNPPIAQMSFSSSLNAQNPAGTAGASITSNISPNANTNTQVKANTQQPKNQSDKDSTKPLRPGLEMHIQVDAEQQHQLEQDLQFNLADRDGIAFQNQAGTSRGVLQRSADKQIPADPGALGESASNRQAAYHQFLEDRRLIVRAIERIQDGEPMSGWSIIDQLIDLKGADEILALAKQTEMQELIKKYLFISADLINRVRSWDDEEAQKILIRFLKEWNVENESDYAGGDQAKPPNIEELTIVRVETSSPILEETQMQEISSKIEAAGTTFLPDGMSSTKSVLSHSDLFGEAPDYAGWDLSKRTQEPSIKPNDMQPEEKSLNHADVSGQAFGNKTEPVGGVPRTSGNIEELTTTGRQLGERRYHLRAELASGAHDAATLDESQKQSLQRQIEEIGEQISQNIQNRMGLIRQRIDELYGNWGPTILSLEESRQNLDRDIQTQLYSLRDINGDAAYDFSPAIVISDIPTDIAENLRDLGRRRHEVLSQLQDIGRQMRESGSEQEIRSLQRNYRVLIMASSAEHGKLASTRVNDYLSVRLDNDTESNHLSAILEPSWTVRFVHSPYRFIDTAHPGYGMSIRIEDDGVAYDDVVSILEATSDLPRAVHTPVVIHPGEYLRGVCFDAPHIYVPNDTPKDCLQYLAWHEGGHDIENLYFIKLEPASQQAILAIYERWLSGEDTQALIADLGPEMDSLYLTSFSEMFAEMRALHKFFSTEAGKGMTYPELVAHTVKIDYNTPARAGFLSNAQELYEALKREVFDPYYASISEGKNERGTSFSSHVPEARNSASVNESRRRPKEKDNTKEYLSGRQSPLPDPSNSKSYFLPSAPEEQVGPANERSQPNEMATGQDASVGSTDADILSLSREPADRGGTAGGDSETYQRRIEELTTTGRQLGERRYQLRTALASGTGDGTTSDGTQTQDLQRQIDEIGTQISENLQNRMDLIDARIWELWGPQLRKLQLRKDDLDWAIDTYDTIEDSVKVFIGDLDKLKAQRQEVMQKLKAIGDQMRSEGIQEQIFRLQRQLRALAIAYSAEKGKIAPTNNLRVGMLDLDPETNHLAWTTKPIHRPFRISDSSHLADEMAVYVEGGDGVDYESVSTILASSTDLPKGKNTPVISVFDAYNDGVYSTSDGVIRVASSRRSTRKLERTSWHEGGHAVHFEYFNLLAEDRQRPVIDAYESWLKRRETLTNGLDSVFQKYRDRLFQRDFIAPEENSDAYRYCFTEVFAEMRAMYKFSLTENGKHRTYAGLVDGVTAVDDQTRARILEDAEDLYNTLKQEVFEPYANGDRINTAKPVDDGLNTRRSPGNIRAAMMPSDSNIGDSGDNAPQGIPIDAVDAINTNVSEQQRTALLESIANPEQRKLVTAFLEKYPDRLALVQREIQRGAPRLDFHSLSGLANLVDHFGYDSPTMQRLFELETTEYLSISVLSDFVRDDQLRAEIVKQEILRGVLAEKLGDFRLTNLLNLANQLGYDSPALRRILNFEAKEDLYIGFLAAFIGDDQTRADTVKQELMLGGVDQIDHHRLQAVLGLSGHFGYESLVMRRLLQFEKHQGVDLVALNKAVGKNENLRTLTATIFGVAQPDSEDVRNWTALANSIDNRSWPLEKYFRIRSEASTNDNLDQGIAQLKERGAQLCDQRRALKQSRASEASSGLTELNAQIQQNIEEVMDRIEVRIEQIYRQWENEIEEAEASRITVGEQQGAEILRAIVERMRNAGDEPRIFALQREYRILEIALAAERGQMPQSMRYVFVPSPETGHLTKAWLDTSYRVNDPTKLTDGIPVKVIGPVNSENVFTVLDTAGKLPPQMPTFIFDANSNPDNPGEQAHYYPSVSAPFVRFYRSAEIQPTEVMARRSRHEVGHVIHHQYFTQLPDTIKGAVYDAYFNWLGKRQTLKNIGVASMSSIDLDLAVADPGFAFSGKGKIELYEYSLSEMFAEMRALYEYSKTSAGRKMSYAGLLHAFTGDDDPGREKAMSNAGSLYEFLKDQVFEPYDRGEGFRPPTDRTRSDRSSSTEQIRPVMMKSLDNDANTDKESTVAHVVHEQRQALENKANSSNSAENASERTPIAVPQENQTVENNQKRKVLQDALGIIKQHSLYRASVDLDGLIDEVLAQGEDPHTALPKIFKQLGDKHSFVHVPIESTEARRDDSQPTGYLLEQEGQPVAVVTIPGFVGADETSVQQFSLAIQRCLSDLASLNPSGWIIDLRENGGGNMWPMLAGLSPFFGDGDIGYFDSRESREAWFCREGNIGFRDKDGQEFVQENLERPDSNLMERCNAARVVVLLGPNTASSAEGVAIAFQNRPNTTSIGQTTAGLATSNRSFLLSDGSVLELTVAMFADRNGNTYESGVTPDQRVEERSENPGQIFSIATQWFNSVTSVEGLGRENAIETERPADTDMVDSLSTPKSEKMWDSLKSYKEALNGRSTKIVNVYAYSSHLQRLEANPHKDAVLDSIPEGSEVIGCGFFRLILRAPSGEVYSIQTVRGEPRHPDCPLLLQPTKTTQYGSILVEELPYADTSNITDADLDAMAKALERIKWRLIDPDKQNLGRLLDGTLVVIDPGAIARISSDDATLSPPTSGGADGGNAGFKPNEGSHELEAILLPIPEGHTRFYSGIPAGIDGGYNCIPLSNEENTECDQLRERLEKGEDLSPELRGRYHELSSRYKKEFDEFEMSRNLAEEQRRIGQNGKVFYVDIPDTELASLSSDGTTVDEEWIFVPWRIAHEAKEFPNNLLDPELVNTFWTPGKSSETLEDSNSFKFDNETKEESLAHYNLSEHAYLRYTIRNDYGQLSGISVLELGPHSSNTIPENLHESAIYTAVDYSRSSLEAQRKYSAHGSESDNILRVQGDTFLLPIRSSSQDLVVATYHDPFYFGQLTPKYAKQAIDQVLRVLKVGGDFILVPWVYQAHPKEINEYLVSKFDLIEEKPDYPGSTSILLVLRKKDGTDGDGSESEPPPPPPTTEGRDANFKPVSRDTPSKYQSGLSIFAPDATINLLAIGKAAGDKAAREAATITKDIAIVKLEQQGFASFLNSSADRSINMRMGSLIPDVFNNERYIIEEDGIRRIDSQVILALAQKLVRGETDPRIVESIYLILTESLQEAMANVYGKYLSQDPKNLAVPTGLTQEEAMRISLNQNEWREARQSLVQAKAASSPVVAPSASVQAQLEHEDKIDLREENVEKGFTDEREKLKKEIGELRSRRIDLQRAKASGEATLAESQSSRVKPEAEIEKVRQAIQEKLRAQMNLISSRITSLYEPWRERIQKLEERRRNLEEGIDFYFPSAKIKEQQFALGYAVDISSMGTYQTNNIKPLGAELQQVLADLRAIGEEMRLAGIEARIFHLQKEHNSLRIAYSAEQDKIAPTNKGRAGGIDLDLLGNYLSSKVKPDHEPFHFADPSHPANDMAVFVEEFDRDAHDGVVVYPGPLFDGIAYDTVVNSLESLSDTPRGVDAHVINRAETSSGGQCGESILMNLYPGMPKKAVEMTGWHEGGHAVQTGYFNNLPQARQKLVIEAYEAWLRKQSDSQLAQELEQVYKQYENKLLAREYIDHSENPSAYFLCFTEVFAELRGLYKFSLTGEAAGLSYKELLSARTAPRSESRAEILEDAEQLYETLKREVFEPYQKGDRVSAPPQIDSSTTSGPEGGIRYDIANPSEQQGESKVANASELATAQEQDSRVVGERKNEPTNQSESKTNDDDERIGGDEKTDRVKMSAKKRYGDEQKPLRRSRERDANDTSGRPARYEAPTKLDWSEGTSPEYIAQELVAFVNALCIGQLAAKVERRDTLAAKLDDDASDFREQLEEKLHSGDNRYVTISRADLRNPEVMRTKLAGRDDLMQDYARYRQRTTESDIMAEYESLEQNIDRYAEGIEHLLNEAICKNENEYPAQTVDFDANLPKKTHGASYVDDVKLVLNPSMFQFGKTDVVVKAITHENKHHQRKSLILAHLIEENIKEDLDSRAIYAVIKDYAKAFAIDSKSDKPLKDWIQKIYEIRRDKPLNEQEKETATRFFEVYRKWKKVQPRIESNQFALRELQDILNKLEDNSGASSELLDSIYTDSQREGKEIIKKLFGRTKIPKSIQHLLDSRVQAYRDETVKEWETQHSDTARQLLLDIVDKSLKRLRIKVSEEHKIYESYLHEVDAREAGERAAKVAQRFVVENEALRLILKLKASPERKIQSETITRIAALIANHKVNYVLDELNIANDPTERRRYRSFKNRILEERAAKIMAKNTVVKMAQVQRTGRQNTDEPAPLKRAKNERAESQTVKMPNADELRTAKKSVRRIVSTPELTKTEAVGSKVRTKARTGLPLQSGARERKSRSSEHHSSRKQSPEKVSMDHPMRVERGRNNRLVQADRAMPASAIDLARSADASADYSNVVDVSEQNLDTYLDSLNDMDKAAEYWIAQLRAIAINVNIQRRRFNALNEKSQSDQADNAKEFRVSNEIVDQQMAFIESLSRIIVKQGDFHILDNLHSWTGRAAGDDKSSSDFDKAAQYDLRQKILLALICKESYTNAELSNKAIELLWSGNLARITRIATRVAESIKGDDSRDATSFLRQELIEDAIQEGVKKLLENRIQSNFDLRLSLTNGSSFDGYTGAAIRNLIFDKLRRIKAQHSHEVTGTRLFDPNVNDLNELVVSNDPMSEVEMEEEAIAKAEQIEQMLIVMQMLPERERQILEMLYGMGDNSVPMAYPEIAAKLNTSYGNARNLVSKATEKLAKYLSGEMEVEIDKKIINVHQRNERIQKVREKASEKAREQAKQKAELKVQRRTEAEQRAKQRAQQRAQNKAEEKAQQIAEQKKQFRPLVINLPDNYRQVLEMRYRLTAEYSSVDEDMMALPEIASRLGLSYSVVAGLIHKAYKELEKHVPSQSEYNDNANADKNGNRQRGSEIKGHKAHSHAPKGERRANEVVEEVTRSMFASERSEDNKPKPLK